MKKVLIAFDGVHFSEAAFEFCRKLNEEAPILLMGLFLPQVNYANLWSYADSIGGSLMISLTEDEEEQVKQNVARFTHLCTHNMIDFRIRDDFSNLALPELKKESKFADLLVIGSEKFYDNIGAVEPNDYLQDALHGVGCPVVLVPENFIFPRTNILSYDGSDSSIYAIKQFAYLFPGLSAINTHLVFIEEKEGNSIPEENYMEELVARHFSNLTITRLAVQSKKEFADWLQAQDGAILVSGSFGRSSFSLVFKKSFIHEVIKAHQVPVFIAHR